MKLKEFIALKPPELRLGQWFFNTYLSRLSPSDNMHEKIQLLYNTRSENVATALMIQIMIDYQCEELPDER